MKTSKASEYRHIESFADLRKKKKELDDEIIATGSKVTSATEHLIDEGVKVVAVGFAGFLISKILSTFMSSRKTSKSSTARASTQAYDSATSEAADKSESSGGERSEAHQEEAARDHNGESKLDTAMTWLDTISGGIEAVRIVLNTVAEKQQAETEKSTEEAEM